MIFETKIAMEEGVCEKEYGERLLKIIDFHTIQCLQHILYVLIMDILLVNISLVQFVVKKQKFIVELLDTIDQFKTGMMERLKNIMIVKNMILFHH